MEIKAADVAKLRKMTGAGMMDCKQSAGYYPRAWKVGCRQARRPFGYRGGGRFQNRGSERVYALPCL